MSHWKVVDANFLRSPLLEDYFRADAGNHVVFTDHGCMEAYKGPGLVNLCRSLDIVSRYPSQVVVLKSTREIVALQSKSACATSREEFVCRVQTRAFSQFCVGARGAASGKAPKIAEQLLAKSQLANDHFASVQRDAELGSQAVRGIAASYDPTLLKQLRTRASISADYGQAIINGILQVAAILFRDHPDVNRVPSGKDLPACLIFRYALAAYLLGLRWISDGGVESVPPGRLANDLVDVTHVSYATYFDGLLSTDSKLIDLYEEAGWFLRNVFATNIPEPSTSEES